MAVWLWFECRQTAVLGAVSGGLAGGLGDELEPTDRLAGGATAAFRSVRCPGRTASPAEGCGGRPVSSGAPVSLSSHPLSLCVRCPLFAVLLLALAVCARFSVCLGCCRRPCGCTGGRCRSEDQRTSAPAGSRPDEAKRAGRPGPGRSGGGRPEWPFSSVSAGRTGARRLVRAARTQDKPAALRRCRCSRVPAGRECFLAGRRASALALAADAVWMVKCVPI